MKARLALSVAILTICLGGGASSPAFSQSGAFDFLDPCKKAEAQFASTSEAMRGRADEIMVTWDARTDPPDNMRSYYVDALREGIYHNWATAPATADLIAQMPAGFDAKALFFEKVYGKVVTPETENEYVRQLYQADYKATIRPKLIEERQKLDRTIDENKDKLDDGCKTDVFNQFFRVTWGNAFILLSANAEAAKREPNIVLGAVRLFSGVSISDIAEHGLLGGPNSEFRNIANGIAGGENSEIRKLLRGLDDNLNPANWKVDIPTITIPTKPEDILPDLPPLPFPVPDLGDVFHF